MASEKHIDRRRFVLSIGAATTAGLLAGCSGGTGSNGQATAEPTPESTPEPTPEPTTEATPEPTPERTTGARPEDPLEAAVWEANNTIESLNEGIATTNDGLENVEDVAPIEPVEAGTAEEAGGEADRLRGEIDRLRNELLTQVAKEINEQAGFEFVSTDLETAEDARAEADSAEGMSSDAATALREVADFVERIEEELGAAADTLESV